MITVFGSINVDLVMQVSHLPRPGETTLCPEYRLVPGGKGANQALAAACAGARVRMVGCVGADVFADAALPLLREADIDLSTVRRSGRSTGCAAVWVEETGENAIVVASGANQDVRASQLAEDMMAPGDWLVLQMEVPPAENWDAMRRAKRRSAKTALSVAPAAPVPEDVLAELDLLLVNRIEGETVASGVGLTAEGPKEIVKGLARLSGGACVMTLGQDGAVAAGGAGWEPGAILVVPALPVNAVDTTGAGDAFAGVLAAALDAGLALEPALRRASVAAGLACTKLGAQTSLPTAAEIAAGLLSPLPPNRWH